MVNSEIESAGAGLANARAFYMAETGRAKARWALTTGAQSVGWGETSSPFGAGKGTYIVTTASPTDAQHVNITSDGYFPVYGTNPVAQRRVVENNIELGSGTNLSRDTNGTVASASDHHGNDTEDKAIDGTNNTGWVAKDKGGSASLTLTYSSANTVSRVVVNGSNIASIMVQYSNNNSSWTNVSNASGALPGIQTFTPITAKYLRLSMVSSSGKRAQVNEFESYSGAGGATTLSQGKFGTSL